MSGAIDLWDDTRIQASAIWMQEIEKALQSADVAVLLISQNFMASPFIINKELQPLLEKSKEGGVKVFWVLLTDCIYENSGIDKYQAAHDIKSPLAPLKKQKRQGLWVQIARNLFALMKKTGTDVRSGTQFGIYIERNKETNDSLTPDQIRKIDIIAMKRLGFEENYRKTYHLFEEMIGNKFGKKDYDFNAVLSEIELIKEAFGANISIIHLEMEVYHWMGEYEKQIEIFKSLIKILDSLDDDYSFWGRYNRTSVKEYKTFQMSDDYAYIGDAHLELKQWREAADNYQLAIKIRRMPYHVYLLLVETLLLLGNEDDAIREHLYFVNSQTPEFFNKVLCLFFQSIYYSIKGKESDSAEELKKMSDLLINKKEGESLRWNFVPVRILIENRIPNRARQIFLDYIIKFEEKLK
jgi:tetratricopeptide (TPR) repeat protein